MSWSRVSVLRAGRCLACSRAGALWRPAALLLTLALGACGSAGPATQWASWSPMLISAPSGGMPRPMANNPQVEIEGDGLEGQRPPRRRTEEAPDDPAEPFSPNYGAVAPAPEPA